MQENSISTQHHQNEPTARKLEPVQPLTPNRPKQTVDESDQVAPAEAAPTVETDKALQTRNEQSVRSTRESHGTQTQPESSAVSPRKAPPPSPRRSYAKTVSNQKPNETLTDVKKDNNETNGKRIINGHDDKLTNGRKMFKTKQQSNETKAPKPKINGVDQQNGKAKGSYQNGYQQNGKLNNRHRVEVAKRPQLQVPTEEIKSNSSDPADDSDMDFRPVESRRNRSGHNGFVRNKYSPQKRSDSVEKVEPKEDQKTDQKAESDKSSTISELSSPTELSSGQTTPQSVEKHANELNKSVEKLCEDLQEQKPKKPGKKNKKNAVRRVEVKEPKVEEIFEEPPPLPEFLQPPKNDLMDLDLGDALDHAFLRTLRQSEPTITKVNLFPTRAPIFPCDLYTRTNLSQMRATKPEEFFASIVETPAEPKPATRKLDKPIKPAPLRKPINTAYKPSKKPVKEEDETKEEKPCLGIVDAVKTWLENQDEPKNEQSNPVPAPSAEGEQVGCRVANPAPDLATLTDAKTSVDKYYSLSVRRMSKTSETSDVSEHDAVDALEYAFPRPPAIAAHNGGFPTKDLACKLQ